MQVVGHGIDLVDIRRIAEMLERHPEQFRARCFTEREQAYAESATGRRAERYAARFACKEAVLKALGTGWRDGIRWTDIGVDHAPSGAPTVRLSGRCEEVARTLGIRRWLVSISHASTPGRGREGGEPGGEGYAIASVIACGGPGG
ncbi:MAG: holo-[acyl-carrier-protein] synthase [Planctomycetes bacterium]|nr:holo-[acyl-carrier-protein] synthase [Planctomycetota bacterium]